MIWISIVSCAFYFAYSFIGDALDLYDGMLKKVINTPSSIIDALTSYGESIESYKSAMRTSLRNFIAVPVVVYSLPVECILSVNLQLIRLVINLTVASLFYLVWIAVIGRGRYRYRIETGSQGFLSFLHIVWVAAIPLYAVPLGEFLIGVYSIVVTFFLMKNNLDRDQDEQRLSPLHRKRSFYAFEEGHGIRA